MSLETQKTAGKAEYNLSIPHTPMRFLWFVSKPYRRYMIPAIAFVTIAGVFSTSVPYILKSLVNTAYAISASTAEYTAIWVWVVAYVLVLCGQFIAWRLGTFLGIEWVTRANAYANTSLFEYLTQHSHTYFSNRFAGSLSGKITHASEGMQGIAEAFLWDYYVAALSLVITFGYMFTVSVPIALLFLCLTIFLTVLNYIIARYRRPHVVAYSAQTTRLRGYAVDAITNVAAVRQFTRKKEEQTRFGEQIEKMRSLYLKQWRISEWGKLINSVCLVIFEGGMLIFAIHLWSQNKITVGDIVMFTALMTNIHSTLLHIGNSMNGFIRRYGDVEEGLSEILIQHEIVDHPDAGKLVMKKGTIGWDNVTFKYEDNSVFDHFNLAIRAGERVGLVGSSGAGKTTFVSLLLRQHELNEGAILIDGQNIAEVMQDSLRENVAVVPQEPMLFHRSIRDNIAYGKPNATDKEIIAVAKKAQAHGFISALKDGYDTLVGERGVKLSGGQKQRVAIARAMLKNARILVLDEATSALDSESEVAIQKALHELMTGKTVIAIAHRLSTLREMDRIIVLEDGKIIEDGNHDTLTKSGGLYARLWEHQAGGFLQD